MKQLKLVLVIAASLLLFACSQKPIKYQPISEMPEGPGLFSGENGAFDIYHNKSKPASSQSPSEKSIQPTEQQKYQSFKNWKSSQDPEYQEYQEFKAWQKTKAGNSTGSKIQQDTSAAVESPQLNHAPSSPSAQP